MKAEVFEGTIAKNSRKLYTVANNGFIATPHDSFVKIGENNILFKIESSNKITIKRPFTASGKNTIKIKGNYENRILKGDLVNVFFDEYIASSLRLSKASSSLEEGAILYCQGGMPSISSKDITGKKCQIVIDSVNEEGEVANVSISYPGRYVVPPENPVTAINELEKPIEVFLDFDLAETSSSAERNITKISASSIDTELELSYELPIGVTEGEIIIEKFLINLDKDYLYDDAYNEVCAITKDFSPSYDFPLMAPNNPSFHSVYNKTIEMLEEKLSSIEKKIAILERRI